MKKSIVSTAFVLLLAYVANAQNNNQLSLQLSLNQFEVAYQHKLFSANTWAEAYGGLGNQDIDNNFNDFLAGLNIGVNVLSAENNQLAFYTSFGVYVPKNDYYNAATSVIGATCRYTRLMGKSKQSSLFVNAGYRYGKRDYIQEFSSENINVATTGSFKIAPLYIALGYRFNF